MEVIFGVLKGKKGITEQMLEVTVPDKWDIYTTDMLFRKEQII